MVETQSCKLRGTSDTLVGRAYYQVYNNMVFVNYPHEGYRSVPFKKIFCSLQQYVRQLLPSCPLCCVVLTVVVQNLLSEL